jgi:3-oxoacyl-[acyl-carrier protein] reductase
VSDSQKTIIVTGGSRGLGLAIIHDLIQKGYRIATCSRKPSTEIESLAQQHQATDRFFWKACAIGDAEQEEAFINAVIDWTQATPIFGLINNAGIAADGVLATFPNRDIEQVLDVNLTGALRMARLVMRILLRQASTGRIINISSIVGSRGYSGLAAYAATKAGLDGMTRALAREVGRRGITVNSVAPGFLETELSGALNDKQQQQIIRRTPLKRLGTVNDITPVIRFLLSEEANFVTGQTWTVDGGLTC